MIYQPILNDGELPEQLYSFDVFKSYEDAQDFMRHCCYEDSEYTIEEYFESDIEDYRLLDDMGYV